VRTAGIVAGFIWMAPLVWAGAADAAEPGERYQGKVIVTGQGEPNRRTGFAQCLEDVLVKVSGDPRLIGDRRVKAMGAAVLVTKFHYRDLMAGRPIRDEQGTRDRPHELTVDFDPAKIDAALQTLGRKPWTGERPRVAVLLAVRNRDVTFVLAADGERGSGQPESLAAASWRVGVPIVVPDMAGLAKANLGFDQVAGGDLARLDAAAKAVGADQALAGRLTWNDAVHGWVAEWRIAAGGKTYAWRVSGVNFDEAFRNALRGTAQVLSGNGQPK
jgi:hypothetical protein